MYCIPRFWKLLKAVRPGGWILLSEIASICLSSLRIHLRAKYRDTGKVGAGEHRNNLPMPLFIFVALGHDLLKYSGFLLKHGE